MPERIHVDCENIMWKRVIAKSVKRKLRTQS